MAFPNTTKFPHPPAALIHNYPGITCFKRKILSTVQYEKNDPLELGLILKTQKGRQGKQFYSIATGKLGKKNKEENNKYYEVYPELYNLEQIRVIQSVFKMIKWADGSLPWTNK